MGIELLLDISSSSAPERIVIGRRTDGLSLENLSSLATGGATVIRRSNAKTVAYLGPNGPAFPVAVFGAARAGIPISPLNYRQSLDQLAALLERLEEPLIIADELQRPQLEAIGQMSVMTTDEWLASATDAALPDACEPHLPPDDDSPAVLLFTSGTTSAPKCVVLRHEHLLAYVLQTIDPASADESDAALVSVPPYHIAGIAAVLTNVYAARRVLYLPQFTPEGWIELIASEEVSSAMVVPTMLARVVEHLADRTAHVPTLTSLAYGGSRLPQPVLERALRVFPSVDFVNAYGLTETSSTIAVLGPDDHRAAIATEDPAIRARLGSAGRLVVGVEGQIRSVDGTICAVDEPGELFVRGPQISGEYVGTGSTLDDENWFSTKDRAWFDADGYLFIEGRMDDTIIRGGENVAPAEIEDVLLAHPDIREAAVLGRPDDEWGERIVAFVVAKTSLAPDEDGVRQWVRERLRGSKTPDDVYFRDELPHTATGKLLRRELLKQIV